MSELRVYGFPARTAAGVLFGLSVPRLAAVGLAGVVFVVAVTVQTAASLLAGLLGIGVLLGVTFVRAGGRPVIEWLPLWLAAGWAAVSRANEFYASPDLTGDLPEGVLDLPGELFGIELHEFGPVATVTVANPTPAAYGVLVDTFRRRAIAVAEVSGEGFLFCDPDEQQGRIEGWGALLDHVAQSLPDVCRLQVVHMVGPATVEGLAAHHRQAGGRGDEATAGSYRQVMDQAGMACQVHRMLVAVALDLRTARRAVRQAGGGMAGSARVLLDRAATVEECLHGGGLAVHGWLPARRVAEALRAGFAPASTVGGGVADVWVPGDVHQGAGVAPAVCGPAGMVDGWSVLRHEGGWSTTLQVVRPPRAAPGDFLQHVLIGVPAQRRMSLLYVPTPAAVAERRAQSQQVSSEAEQTVRAKWGFGISARHRRTLDEAERREEELVDGRSVYRLVWLLTVTGTTPEALADAVGQVEAAARRSGLELRPLVGTQRQAAGCTLPLCRGAR